MTVHPPVAFLLQTWLGAFLLTIVTELPVLLVILRRHVALPKVLGVGLAVNLVTHPIVWFVLPRLLLSKTSYLLVAEAFALVVEAGLLWALLASCAPSRALLASAAANGASYFVGLGLYVATVGRLP